MSCRVYTDLDGDNGDRNFCGWGRHVGCYIQRTGCDQWRRELLAATPPPPPHNPDTNTERSYLSALCDDGQQAVKVTKVLKKNVQLMFPSENAQLRYLEDAATPPAPSETSVKWSIRYLVEKDKQA